MDSWGTSPAIINETVLAVKEFLDAELVKYENWEDVSSSLIKLLSLDGRHKFEDIKAKGVGQTTILKFLGKPWKQWMIQGAVY